MKVFVFVKTIGKMQKALGRKENSLVPPGRRDGCYRHTGVRSPVYTCKNGYMLCGLFSSGVSSIIFANIEVIQASTGKPENRDDVRNVKITL